MKKQLFKVVPLSLKLYMCVLGACKDEKSPTVMELFPEFQPLSQNEEYYIDEDSLAVIEGLVCDGKNLIAYNYRLGNCYTLFDEESGEYIADFGTIGQGPGEIPSPCYGYLSRNCFSVFNDQAKMVMKYNLDSLRSDKKYRASLRLTSYNIPDAQISRLISIDDSTFLCAGAYKSRYQYVLFDKNDKVLDYGVDVYNATDSAFQVYTRYLSNQGDLVMNPEKRIFAYSVNFSSNMDFFEIVNNKIKLIKSLRLGNPIYNPVANGESYSADLTENSQTGYINLSATSKYVYALYSDKKLYENGRKSNVVLAFDWEGKPFKRYELDAEAYSIAVDDDRKCLFAAVKNSTGGWSIVSYGI